MLLFKRAVIFIVYVVAFGVVARAWADDFPIFGDWIIANAVIAPWVEAGEDRASYEAAAKPRLNLVLTFRPDAVIARDSVLGCTDANYERTLYPPEALFQGGLPEPDQAQLARELGLPAGDVPGFDVSCSTGLFSYHFAVRDRLLFALDNMIYMLDRRTK